MSKRPSVNQTIADLIDALHDELAKKFGAKGFRYRIEDASGKCIAEAHTNRLQSKGRVRPKLRLAAKPARLEPLHGYLNPPQPLEADHAKKSESD